MPYEDNLSDVYPKPPRPKRRVLWDFSKMGTMVRQPGTKGAFGRWSWEYPKEFDFKPYIGYQPTYWQRPQAVARYHQAIQNLPPGQTPPQGFNRDEIEMAYEYFKNKNNNDDWWNWKFLSPLDPGREYLSTIPDPPPDVRWYGEENYVAPPPPYEPKPYEQLPQPGLGGVSEEEYANYSWEQRAVIGILSRPILASPLQGAAIGAFGGVPGIIGGGLLGGVFGLVGEGALAAEDTELEGIAQGGMNLLNFLDYPAEVVERAIGTLDFLFSNYQGMTPQQAGRAAEWAPSLEDMAAEGLIKPRTDYDTFREKLNNLGAVWKTAHLYYETRPIGRTFQIAPEFAGREKEFQPNQGLIYFQDAYEAIRDGATPDEVRQIYDEVLAKQGVSGQMLDLAGHVFLDPLNVIGGALVTPVLKGALKLAKLGNLSIDVTRALDNSLDIAKATGNLDDIAHAGDVAQQAKKLNINSRHIVEMAKPGSHGVVSAIRNLGVVVRRVVPAQTLADTNTFGRWLGAVDAAGTPRVLNISEAKGIKGWASRFFGLTPAARANELINTSTSVMGVVLDRARTPDGEFSPSLAAKYIHSLSNTPIDLARELSMVTLEAPDAVAIPMALKDNLQNVDTLVAAWEAAQGRLDALRNIAEKTGKSLDDVINDLGNEQGATRLLSQIMDVADDKVKAAILSPMPGQEQLTPQALVDLAKPFHGASGIGYTPEKIQAQFMALLEDRVAKWGVDWFKVKSDPGWIRVSNAVKSAQSFALLGFSPTYFLNNAINNMVTMAAEGVLGTYTPKKIAGLWERVGVTPPRIKAGVGVHASGLEQAHEVVRAAVQGKGRVFRMPKWMQDAQVFARLSGWAERQSSAQATTAAFVQFWRRAWKKDVGYSGMPAHLEDRLRSVNPDAVDYVYAAIQGGMNQQEIEARLWQGFMRNDVTQAAPEIARRTGFTVDEINDALDAVGATSREVADQLSKAETPEMVRGVLNGIEERAQDYLDEQTGRNLEMIARRNHNRIQLEGAQAAIELIDDLSMQLIDQTFNHWVHMDNAAQLAEGAVGGSMRGLIWEDAMQKADRSYKRHWKRVEAGNLGIVTALGIDSDYGIQAGKLIGDQSEAWAKFYALRSKLYRDYDAGRLAWAQVQEKLSPAWEAAYTAQEAALDQLDDLYVLLFEARYGDEAGTIAKEWRSGNKSIRNKMHSEMKTQRESGEKAWRDFLKGGYLENVRAEAENNMNKAREAFAAAGITGLKDKPEVRAVPTFTDVDWQLGGTDVNKARSERIQEFETARSQENLNRQQKSAEVRRLAQEINPDWYTATPTGETRFIDGWLLSILNKYGGRDERIYDLGDVESTEWASNVLREWWNNEQVKQQARAEKGAQQRAIEEGTATAADLVERAAEAGELPGALPRLADSLAQKPKALDDLSVLWKESGQDAAYFMARHIPELDGLSQWEIKSLLREHFAGEKPYVPSNAEHNAQQLIDSNRYSDQAIIAQALYHSDDTIAEVKKQAPHLAESIDAALTQRKAIQEARLGDLDSYVKSSIEGILHEMKAKLEAAEVGRRDTSGNRELDTSSTYPEWYSRVSGKYKGVGAKQGTLNAIKDILEGGVEGKPPAVARRLLDEAYEIFRETPEYERMIGYDLGTAGDVSTVVQASRQATILENLDALFEDMAEIQSRAEEYYPEGIPDNVQGEIDKGYEALVERTEKILELEGRKPDPATEQRAQSMEETRTNMEEWGEDLLEDDPDMLFQDAQPESKGGRLVAIHNLDPAELIKANEVGGFPMPSLAITRKGENLNAYGTVSLIAKPSVVKKGVKSVYTSDAYTAKYPRPLWNTPSYEKLTEVMKPFSQHTDLFIHPSDQYQKSIMYELTAHLQSRFTSEGDVIGVLEKSSEVMYEYLTTQHPDIIKDWEIPQKPPHETPSKYKWLASDKAAPFLQWWDENLSEIKELWDNIGHRQDVARVIEEEMQPYVEAYQIDANIKAGLDPYTYPARPAMVDNIDDVINDIELVRAPKVPDEYTARHAMQRMIEDNNLGYEFWKHLKENVVDKLLPTEKGFLEYGRLDYYTGVGKKLKISAENALKVMKKEMRDVRAIERDVPYSTSALVAELSEPYRSMTQLRGDEGRLVTREMLQDYIHNVQTPALEKGYAQVHPYYAGQYSDVHHVYYDAIAQYGRSIRNSGHNDARALGYLRDHGFQVPTDNVQALRDFQTAVDVVLSPPTEYFEMKQPRVWDWNDWGAAVVPTNVPEEVLKLLEDKGIKVEFYEPGEGKFTKDGLANRQDAVMRLQEQGLDLFFQDALERQSDDTWHRPFYLKSAKLVEDFPQDTFTVEQLGNYLKKQGVKKDEMNWTTLDDFLGTKALDEKVTKQQVLDYIGQHDVELKEVWYGGEPVERVNYFTRQLEEPIKYEWEPIPDDEAWKLSGEQNPHGKDFVLYPLRQLGGHEYAIATVTPDGKRDFWASFMVEGTGEDGLKEAQRIAQYNFIDHRKTPPETLIWKSLDDDITRVQLIAQSKHTPFEFIITRVITNEPNWHYLSIRNRDTGDIANFDEPMNRARAIRLANEWANDHARKQPTEQRSIPLLGYGEIVEGSGNRPQHDRYTIPGGENYKELVLTWKPYEIEKLKKRRNALQTRFNTLVYEDPEVIRLQNQIDDLAETDAMVRIDVLRKEAVVNDLEMELSYIDTYQGVATPDGLYTTVDGFHVNGVEWKPWEYSLLSESDLAKMKELYPRVTADGVPVYGDYWQLIQDGEGAQLWHLPAEKYHDNRGMGFVDDGNNQLFLGDHGGQLLKIFDSEDALGRLGYYLSEAREWIRNYQKNSDYAEPAKAAVRKIYEEAKLKYDDVARARNEISAKMESLGEQKVNHIKDKYGALQDELLAARDALRGVEQTTYRKQAHWGGVDNPLMHIRQSERADPKTNKRMMFVEEVQSDWHQERWGKGVDYQQTMRANERELERVRARQDEVQRMIKELNESEGLNWADDYADLQSEWAKLSIEADYWDSKLRGLQEDYNRQLDKGKAGTIPDAPFSTLWYEVAMKRALRYAAENNYDSIGWTSGSVHSDRWRLTNFADTLEYRLVRHPDDLADAQKTYHVRLHSQENGVVLDKQLKQSELADWVGGNPRDEIVRNATDTWTMTDTEAIPINDQFMMKLYDQEITKAMAKIGKKFGVEPEQTQINLSYNAWRMDIPPEMRESVMQGLPLFQKPRQGGLFEKGEDLPLFSGTAQRAQESVYQAADQPTQGRLFDTRPEMKSSAQVGVIRKRLRDAFINTFLTEQGNVLAGVAEAETQADAVLALLDARATVWAKRTGKTPAHWYQSRIAGIERRDPGNYDLLQQSYIGKPTEFTREQLVNNIREIGLIDTNHAAELLSRRDPEYLFEAQRFMLEQRKKLLDGRMTGRDIAKALLHTIGSQGAQERYVPGLKAKLEAAGFKIDWGLLDDVNRGTKKAPQFRPEDIMGAFLLSDEGKAILDAIENKTVTPAQMDRIAELRKQFGDDRVRTMGVIGVHSKSTGITDYAPPTTGKNKYNLWNVDTVARDINEIVPLFKTDPDAAMKRLDEIALRIAGVGTGKLGFIKSLLGMGNTPTFDTVEVTYWLSGRKTTRGMSIETLRDRVIRSIADRPAWLNVDEVSDAIHPEIVNRFYELRELGYGRDFDPDLFEALMHHYVWDAVKGTETTHRSMFEAQMLAQGTEGKPPRAGVYFLDDGRAMLVALEKPDVSSLAHEIGHIFRRDLDAEDLRVAAEWAGAKDGVWHRDAEEKFAKGFEKYLATGKAPNFELKIVFEQFKEWLAHIYARMREYIDPGSITPEMRMVYNRLLEENPEAYQFNITTQTGRARQSSLFQDGVEFEDGRQAEFTHNAPEPVKEPLGMGDSLHTEAPVMDMQNTGFDKVIEPALDGLRSYMFSDQGAEPIPANALEGLSKDDIRQLRGYLAQVYGQQADTKLAGVTHAEARRDASLLNYERRYGFDNYLGAVMPYHLWYDRSVVKWAGRIIDKPTWLANMYRLQRFQEQAEPIEGYPSRLKGKVKVGFPWLPDWASKGIYVDPLRQSFPFMQFAQPFERYAEQNNMVARRAQALLQQWAEEEGENPAEVEKALSTMQGELWKKAYAQAKVEVGAEIENPIDFVNLATGFSLPINWAYQAVTGRPERISPLPISRTVRGVTAALGANQGRGINIEAPIRKAFGLPEWDRYEDYRVDYWLSNMAAEGLIDADTAQQAMEDRGNSPNQAANQAFIEAQARSAKKGAISLVGAPFSVDIFPEGEQRQRTLKNEYSRAAEAWRAGDDEALQKFFEKYPEYEARVASFKEPQERMRAYLRSIIWDAYHALPALHRRQAPELLGDTFQRAFLDKETRSYDSISTETLLAWARALSPADQQPQTQALSEGYRPELDFPDQLTTEAYEEMQRQRDAMFPDISPILDIYYRLPDQMKALYKEKNPQIQEYEYWRTQYLAANPDVIPYSISEDNKVASASKEIQGKYYQYLANRDSYFPGIMDLQAQFFDAGGRGQAPRELQAYWDWRRQFMTANPDMIPYIMSTESLARKVLGDEYQPQPQGAPFEGYQFEGVNPADIDRMLARQLTLYYLSGKSLSKGARVEIERLRKVYAYPGTIDDFINTAIRDAVSP